MRKRMIFLGISMLIYTSISYALPHAVKRDELFSNLYYNAHLFPHGLFDCDGNSRISKKDFEQSLFAWDLNGVFFKTAYPTSYDVYEWSMKQGYGFFKSVFLVLKLWTTIIYLLLTKDPRLYVWDGHYSVLEENQNRKEVVVLLRQLSKKVNELDIPVIDLMYQLSKSGYYNAIISNMGKKLVDLQIEHLLNKVEKSKDPVERKYIGQAIAILTQPINTISSEENGWLHKPERAMYHDCITQTQSLYGKSLSFFIDDEVRFVVDALDDGLFSIGIHFKDAENTRVILNALGVPFREKIMSYDEGKK